MSDVVDERVVREARALAVNFAPYGEARAVADIRNHIKSFWPKPMRDALRAQMARPEPALPELVRKAAEGL